MKKKQLMVTAAAVLTAVFVAYTAYSLTFGDEPAPPENEVALNEQADQGGPGMGRDPRMQSARGGGQGQGMGAGMGMGPGMGGKKAMLVMKIFERVLDDPEFQQAVGLTDAQLDKVETLLDQSQRSMVRSHADMQILQMDLEDLMDADNPDVKKIDAKIDEIGRIQTQCQKDMAHLLLELRQIVTDDQIEKAKQYFKQKKQEKRGQKGNRGGNGGRGGGQGMPQEFEDDLME